MISNYFFFPHLPISHSTDSYLFILTDMDAHSQCWVIVLCSHLTLPGWLWSGPRLSVLGFGVILSLRPSHLVSPLGGRVSILQSVLICPSCCVSWCCQQPNQTPLPTLVLLCIVCPVLTLRFPQCSSTLICLHLLYLYSNSCLPGNDPTSIKPDILWHF